MFKQEGSKKRRAVRPLPARLDDLLITLVHLGYLIGTLAKSREFWAAMKAPNGAKKDALTSSTSCSPVVRRPPPPLLPLHLHPLPSHRDTRLLDLFDDLLPLIMALLDPLRDLFSLRRTCRRFAELGTVPELSLLVVGGGGGRGELSSPSSAAASSLLPRPRARSCHSTLAEAVAAARPGDTVRVSPTRRGRRDGENEEEERGEQGRRRKQNLHHEISRPILVSSPLLIRGCGLTPEDTILKASFSSGGAGGCLLSAALSFSAAAVLENLSVVATFASPSPSSPAVAAAMAAVHHTKGAVTISRCCLVSSVGQLSHLHAPLVTSAVGSSCSESKTSNVLRVEETRISRRRTSSGSRSGGNSSLGGVPR